MAELDTGTTRIVDFDITGVVTNEEVANFIDWAGGFLVTPEGTSLIAIWECFGMIGGWLTHPEIRY